MKHYLIKNISFNLMLRLATYLFSFLTLMYVTRVLQPETFGKTSFASSFTGYFVMIAALGMPTYALRSCAAKRDNRKELSRIFNELWSINVILSIASIGLLLLSILLVPKLYEDRLILILYGSSIIFQMIGCEWLFKALEKYKLLLLTSVFCKSIFFVCILLFVHSKEQTILYIVFYLLTTYGSNIVCFLLIHRYVDISFHLHINPAHFKPLMVFFLMACAVRIYGSLDLTMLGFMKTDYETGLYSLASKGKHVLAITGGLVWNPILPTASKLWSSGKKNKFKELAIKSILGVCAVQTAVMIICIIFARQLIILAGGEDYTGAVTSFRILLLSLLPIGASNIIGGQVLVPAGMEKRLLRAEIVGAIFNFFANLILIPFLSIEGASLTTVISEIIVWFICAYYAKKDLNMDFFTEPLSAIPRLIKSRLKQ